MSSLETRKIEPATGTTVTLGAGGDTVLVSANQLKTNTVKDAGGNTIFTSDGAGTLSSVNSALSGGVVFITSQTASSSSSISFTTQLTSAYKKYIFYFVNMNPATNSTVFEFQCNASGLSGFNETMTTTYFSAGQPESGGSGTLQYENGKDQALGTSYQPLTNSVGNVSDESCAGELHLFSPSSTTYIKHFYARMQTLEASNYCEDTFIAGYINTTSAITEIDFKFASGNINAGIIYLYGIN